MKLDRLLVVAILFSVEPVCQPKVVNPVVANADWTEESHGDSVDPNYAEAFSQTDVKTMEITMTADDWQAIRSDMVSKFGDDFGGSGNGANPGNGGMGNLGTADPDYVALPIKINGKLWDKVGFRLAGNSDLAAAWRSGIYKLPFRLTFDAFEDMYPIIKNQRYYGFNELRMSPAYSDNSLLREKIVADVFRQAGVPAAQTAFYRVYIDVGSGKKYCGVYTMVEVIDDTMVNTQFGKQDGNIYQPESTLQTFVQRQFEKKNNEKAADYSDVQAFILALNATNRMSDPATWRSNLEKTFNMDHYLKYLAVNNTIVNGDSYGTIPHNYYLYNSPTSKLNWIPWNHNIAMSSLSGSGGAQGGGGMGKAVSLEMSEVGPNWPLIRFVAQDPVYYATYKRYVKTFATTVFTTTNMNTMIDQNYTLIAPYVLGAEKEQKPYSYLNSVTDFTNAIPALKNHVAARNQAVTVFLK